MIHLWKKQVGVNINIPIALRLTAEMGINGEKLEIQYVPIESLKEFPMNPRRNDAAAESLAKLMGEYGFVIPIVATLDGTIRAGHTRIKAARKQGMTEVPVIFVDFGDEKKAVAFSLADNKSHEYSEWDFPKLKDLVVELDDGLFNMALTGFKEEELKEIFDYEKKDEVKAGAESEYYTLEFKFLKDDAAFVQESLHQDRENNKEKLDEHWRERCLLRILKKTT